MSGELSFKDKVTLKLRDLFAEYALLSDAELQDWESDWELVELASQAGRPDFQSALDKIAWEVALAFHGNKYDFDFCDVIANTLWGAAIDYSVSNGASMGVICTAVYMAFDDGEDSHFGRSSDPVNEFTIPKIAEILADQSYQEKMA